jgi:hypothetical protein
VSEAEGQIRQSADPVVTEPVPDLQLQMLVRLVEQEPEARLPVTLIIAGGLLSGDLIAHEAWKSDWARSLRDADGPGAKLLERFPEQVDQVVAEKQGHIAQRLPQWIHLSDAVTVTGAGKQVLMPLWRGRLTDVSGWSLGKPE